MSIATEISRINKAKKDIKNVVNVDFEKITSELVSEYPPKIEELIAQYKSYIPHETTQETTIKAIPLGFKQDVYGNVEQETTSGNNLLENKGTNKSENGITFTVNSDKTVQAKGTATAFASITINSSITLPAGTYYLTGCPEGGSTQTYYLDVLNENYSSIAKDLGSGISFTLSNTSIVRIYARVQNGTTMDKIFKPMISNKSGVSYEPFTNGASPNPSYPQSVETLRGYNEFEPNMPSRTFNNVVITNNGDGSYTFNGTPNADINVRLDQEVNGAGHPKYYDGTYSLSLKSDKAYSNCYINVMNFATYEQLMRTGTSLTKNIKSGDSGSFIYLTLPNGVPLNNQTFYVQIKKGNDSPWQPHGKIGVKLVGENPTGCEEGKQYIISLKANDKITVKNTGSTQITMSLFTNYGDTTRNDYWTITANSIRVITVAKDTNSIAFTNTSGNVWLAKGSYTSDTMPSYTPYIEQITNIDLKGNEMLKEDYITIENGRAKLNKIWGKVVLGILTWTYDSNNKLFQTPMPSGALLTRGIDFKCGICRNGGNKPTSNLALGEGEIVNNGNFYLKDTVHTTVTDFINDIGNEQLYYQLSTPEVIDLGEVDYKLLEGTNNISVLATMNPTKIETSYYVDKR